MKHEDFWRTYLRMGTAGVGNRHWNERVAQRTGHCQTFRALYGTSLTIPEGSIKNELANGHQRSILQKQGTIFDDEKQCGKNFK